MAVFVHTFIPLLSFVSAALHRTCHCWASRRPRLAVPSPYLCVCAASVLFSRSRLLSCVSLPICVPLLPCVSLFQCVSVLHSFVSSASSPCIDSLAFITLLMCLYVLRSSFFALVSSLIHHASVACIWWCELLFLFLHHSSLI